MNYQDKTKDELTKELQKLQKEYDLLKTSYEKEIIERKQIAETLEFTRMILDNAADTMVCIDYDGRYIDFNEALCRSVGYSREELFSMTVHDIDPNYPDGIWPKFMEKLKQAGSLTFESLHRTKEGKTIPVEIIVSFFEHNGKEYHCGFARDITERKQAEDALRQSEMKLKTLFEILPIGVSILDAERNIAFINPALKRTLNITKDGFIRGDYKNRKYIRPDGTQMPEEEFASVRAIREQRVVNDVETGVLMEDGHVIWTNVNAAPVAFPDWKVVIITTDITERKQVEEALQESETRYRELFNNISSGIAIYEVKDNGNDFIFKDFNRAGERIDGNKKEDIIGKSIYQVRPGINKFGLLEVFRRVFATGIPEHYPARFYIDEKLQGWYNNFVYRLPSGEIVAIYDDISERKKAEEVLHLEKENFRYSLDDSPLGVRIATIEGNTIYANKTLLNLYGYDSLGELQKIPLKDRYTPESYLRAQKRKLRRERSDFSDTEYEISIIRKNGEIRRLQVFRKEVLWDGVRQFQVICSDITDRKHAEEALHESEERYRRLVEGSPDAIAVYSKGRFVFVNPAGAKLIGVRSPRKLIGKPILDVVHPDSRSQVIERLRHVVEGQEAPLFEEKFLKSDGSVIDVEVVGIPFSYQGNAATQVVVRDITERKQAEAVLRESEQKISKALEFNRKILDTSSIGILTYKKSGQCVSANKAAAKAVGATMRQLLAQNFHEIPSWKKSGMYQAAIKALNTGIEQLLDVHLVTTFRKNVWLSLSFLSFDSRDEKHLLVFVSDINERKQTEEEIRKSKKLLEDLHKHLNEILENERALISREIHDQIGQSLTALKLDLNWMHKDIKTNPEAGEKLEGMIELVSNTIKDVQRISSDLRPGILDDLGLAAAIEWYCDEFEKRTGIKCSLKLDDSIFGDSTKDLIFFRILQEALTNVIRHANASSITIKLHHSQKGTTLTIQDNGIGITGDKVESTKSLGLIGMRERVRQFGGKVNISSEKGQGTKLIIFIPEKKVSES